MILARPVKLSDAQFVALLWMVKHGEGKIVRWNGGFWTIRTMGERGHFTGSGYRVPLWHTGTQTVMAMERAGLLKRSEEEQMPYLQYWQAPRVVTEAGRLALDVAVTSGQCAQALKKWNLADDLKAFDSWGPKELSELEDMKPVRIKFSLATKDYKCHHCSIVIGIGREVMWIRTKGDDKFVFGQMLSGSTWKSKPWHRGCWDQWEFAIDQSRMRLERILGEDHHEFRSI